MNVHWILFIILLVQLLFCLTIVLDFMQDRRSARMLGDFIHVLHEDFSKMTTQFANLQQAVDTLTATVTAEDTVIDGAVTLISGIPDLIKSAVNDALAKGAPPSTLSAFGTLNDVIQQKADALANAVATSKTGAPTPNPPSGASASSTAADTGGDTSGSGTPDTGHDGSGGTSPSP